MPKKSIGWPTVGQISPDPEEHSRLIQDEARQLIEFGIPSDDNSTGKQCPYHTLNAFCTSVLAFLESSRSVTVKSSETRDRNPALDASFQAPLQTPKKKLDLEDPNFYKTFRRGSAPLTPQNKDQERKVIQPSERPQPLDILTYGVLVLYVPSNFDVDNQKRAIDGIESVNKGYIPGISIKSIEWLIPDWTKTKHYSNLLVEFEHPQHANAAIREQLLIGNKVLSCEYYERNSRLRQCFFCQQYRHQDIQCQALNPVCGRCAGRHVTPNCKLKEDAHSFRCAICGGSHRAWDNACRVRQEELDRVRKSRANAPKFHGEDGKASEDLENSNVDIPSREFAGTHRYSIDFLVEVNLRGGRRSHGRSKVMGGQQSNPLAVLDSNTRDQELKTPPSARPKLEYADLEDTATPQSSGKAAGSDIFKDWIRSRLLTLGIEPYTPGALKRDPGTEDVDLTPGTPSPALNSNRNWSNSARGDYSGTMPDRTKRSLEFAMRQVERSPSEKAANVAKIRNSDRWR